MEIIELPGYTLEEKEDIATRYVLPKVMTEHGLKPGQIKIERQALRKMITDYAREPGLRTLQQLAARIARKAAAQIVTTSVNKPQRGLPKPIIVTLDGLTQWLGPQRFYNEIAERITAPGVVTGLAWTAMGGDILFIEAQETPGSGNLKITGQLGEVMTESAAIARSYVKKKVGKELKLDQEYFRHKDIHLHVPAGAIPKDGPSAGVTMATALLSLLTGRVCKHKIAMTGELSLIGKVLPVGGIKEKILAAKRAGITTVILPKHNEKDVADVPEYALKGMTLHFASHVEEVFALALGEAVQPPKRKKPQSRVIRTVSGAKKSKLAPKRSPSKNGRTART
jgi:ATP-dependent Lon protease